FGYEQHRLRLEPIIRAAEQREIKSVPEFLALGAHQVVLEAGAAGKGAKPGFSAIGMTVLGPTTTALQKALTFNVATPALSLTVRDRPVLLEPDSRYTVLLPGVPRINGSAALAPGTHSFATLSLEAEGYELKVEVPATVSIEPGRTVVRLQ
ncbi:MAG TPA: hypothetical protein VGR19_08840, partial [Allosphingosinicella sp.]|nr:hypothetical protein [Allosphingosinicella sp.]